MSERSEKKWIDAIISRVQHIHEIGIKQYDAQCDCPDCRAKRTLAEIDAKFKVIEETGGQR